jgi:hypothetical protein
VKILKALLTDLIGLGGLASVSYGAWLYSQPLGFVVSGACAFMLALTITIQNRPTQ